MPMDVRSAHPSAQAHGHQAGATLLELSLVLALAGALALLGLGRLEPGGNGIRALQGELRGCLEQAFLRAQAQGGTVQVAPQAPGGLEPLILPRGVRWGLPAAGVPLPPGMDPPVQAHRLGWAHPRVPVTPRHTALASAWFLTDGRDALCLRLAPHGQLQLLRWRQREQRWRRA